MYETEYKELMALKTKIMINDLKSIRAKKWLFMIK